MRSSKKWTMIWNWITGEHSGMQQAVESRAQRAAINDDEFYKSIAAQVPAGFSLSHSLFRYIAVG